MKWGISDNPKEIAPNVCPDLAVIGGLETRFSYAEEQYESDLKYFERGRKCKGIFPSGAKFIECN